MISKICMLCHIRPELDVTTGQWYRYAYEVAQCYKGLSSKSGFTVFVHDLVGFCAGLHLNQAPNCELVISCSFKFAFIIAMLKQISRKAVLTLFSCTFLSAFPSPSSAAAFVNLDSSITVNAFFNAALGPSGYEAFSNYDPPSFSQTIGFGDVALSSSNSTVDQGQYDSDGNFLTVSETNLDFDLLWTGPEWGFGLGFGYAETGFTINLANSGPVTITIDPDINVQVGSDQFSFAFAGIQYDVRWNGRLVDDFAGNLFLLSAGGQCYTISCAYVINQPFQVSLHGVAGLNTLYIDPTFNSSNGVPGPLPLLGVGAAYGSTRKLRRRIKLGNQ
jgi:hypothetical protein